MKDNNLHLLWISNKNRSRSRSKDWTTCNYYSGLV